jgi:hypothetical protein
MIMGMDDMIEDMGVENDVDADDDDGEQDYDIDRAGSGDAGVDDKNFARGVGVSPARGGDGGMQMGMQASHNLSNAASGFQFGSNDASASWQNSYFDQPPPQNHGPYRGYHPPPSAQGYIAHQHHYPYHGQSAPPGFPGLPPPGYPPPPELQGHHQYHSTGFLPPGYPPRPGHIASSQGSSKPHQHNQSFGRLSSAKSAGSQSGYFPFETYRNADRVTRPVCLDPAQQV